MRQLWQATNNEENREGDPGGGFHGLARDLGQVGTLAYKEHDAVSQGRVRRVRSWEFAKTRDRFAGSSSSVGVLDTVTYQSRRQTLDPETLSLREKHSCDDVAFPGGTRTVPQQMAPGYTKAALREGVEFVPVRRLILTHKTNTDPV